MKKIKTLIIVEVAFYIIAVVAISIGVRSCISQHEDKSALEIIGSGVRDMQKEFMKGYEKQDSVKRDSI